MVARRRRVHRRQTGSVRKLPSGRYQARFLGPDGVTRPAPTTFATSGEADDWIASQQVDVSRGRWHAPELGAELLRDYFDRWLTRRTPDFAPRTVALYRGLADRYVLLRLEMPSSGGNRSLRHIELGARQVRHITASAVEDWRAAALLKAAAAATARANGPSRRVHPARAWAVANGIDVPATGRLSAELLERWQEEAPPEKAPAAPKNAGRTQVAQAYSLLRSVLADAVAKGVLPSNPCRIPKGGEAPHDERVPATFAELELITAAMPERYRAAVTVAAWSGLRAGELFALRRRDVGTGATTLRVDRAQVELSGQPVTYSPPKSEAGSRVVHLPESVAAILAAHLDEHVARERDALIFATESLQPVRESYRSQMFRKARHAAGRDDLRWHDLRHTGATEFARAGATQAELQRRLGHSTQRAAAIYQHAADERDRLLAERLEERITTAKNVVPIQRATKRRSR
jgi:integrase